MKNFHFKKARKLLLVLALVTLLLTPIYSMINSSGYIWEIDYDYCVSCELCSVIASEYILFYDRPFFIDGNINGGSSFYLDYSPTMDPILKDAYENCPCKDLAFKVSSY
ncbi:MAG: hypothetical protein WC833_05930 [Bacteroidales bacterium]|jgi:hypothetical protein